MKRSCTIEEQTPPTIAPFGLPMANVTMAQAMARVEENVLSGQTYQIAPVWVRRLHMEWFYRMAQEPLSVLPRYAVDAAALVRHLLLGWIVSRLEPGERSDGAIQIDVQQTIRTIATPAKLCGDCRA